MQSLKNPMVRLLIVFFAIFIPTAAYFFIITIWLPGIEFEPFRVQVRDTINMELQAFFTGLAFALTGLFGYVLLLTFRQKALYRSSEPVTLKAISNPKWDRWNAIISTIFCVGMLLWFVLKHWWDIGALVTTGYLILLYLSIFSVMPLLTRSCKIIFYQDRFKYGLKVFQGHALSMIQLDEATGTIHFKHSNTRCQFVPPADQLHQHYESLLRCTGKEFSEKII